MHFKQFKAHLMPLLLAMVVAAPVVDAIACDDCKDIVPVRETRQSPARDADHSTCKLQSHDACRSAQQETGAAQDLCPVCANIGVVIDAACCGVPSLISRTNLLPKLIAFSDPSFSITKPPQN